MTGQTVRLQIAAVVALAWLGGAASAWALDVRGYGIFKNQDFIQTSTNPPVLQTEFPPCSFSAVVQPNGLFTNQVWDARVESPPFGLVDALTSPPIDSDQPLVWYFGAPSQTEVDASYATGVYTLRFSTAQDGNKVLLLNLTTNQFPANAPRVANHIQAQTIDSLQEFVLRWDPFAGGTTDDSIGFSMADTNGRVVFRSASFGAEPGLTLLNGTNTSIRIPAGTLQAGMGYSGYLYFEKDVTVNLSYPGARGLVGFSKATAFALSTIGPPRLEALGTAGNRFSLRLQGSPAIRYVIQAAPDVAATNWTTIQTNVGTFEFTDPAGIGLGRRFYRAFQAPALP